MVIHSLDAQNVLLSGSSGMLGTAIGEALAQRGAKVLRLVRREAHGPGEVRWNPADRSIADPARLEGMYAAVHLSGANAAKQRWTAEYKREMTESRIRSTQLLAETLAKLQHRPQVLAVASAVGFYGDRDSELLDEDSVAGPGFFPELCMAWEAASRAAEEAGIRVAHLRFGMVLGPHGGALARLTPIFRLGLGGRLGNGKQWVSWIHEADAASATLFALENSGLAGSVNVTAPEPVTNGEFTQALGRTVHRPAILPVPAFGLRLIFGEMADEALLASTRVVPKRLLDAGFQFTYPSLKQALDASFQNPAS